LAFRPVPGSSIGTAGPHSRQHHFSEHTGYDDADRLLTLHNLKSDGTVISSFAYAYDQTINKTLAIEADGVRVTWSYDKTYQLTREQRSGANAYDTTYSYDAAQNRRLKIDSGARTTYTCDATNQLSWVQDSSGRTTYTFDAAGNQQRLLSPTGQRTTYVWDYENRTTQVRLPSGVRNTFAYEPDGKRMEKADSGGSVRFVWDGDSYTLETDASGGTVAAYTNHPGRFGTLVSQRRSATSAWFHFDGARSTRSLSASTGTATDQFAYTAWGNAVASSGSTATPFKYQGLHRMYEESALASHYMIARWFQSAIGRWTSRDPEWDDSTASTFVFCNNRPIVEFDPNGKKVHVFAIEGGGSRFYKDIETTTLKDVFEPVVTGYKNAVWHYYEHVHGFHVLQDAIIEEIIQIATTPEPEEGPCCVPRIVLLGHSFGGASVAEIVRRMTKRRNRAVPTAFLPDLEEGSPLLLIDAVFTLDPVFARLVFGQFGAVDRTDTWPFDAADLENWCYWYSAYQSLDTKSAGPIGIKGDIIRGVTDLMEFNDPGPFFDQFGPNGPDKAHGNLVRLHAVAQAFKDVLDGDTFYKAGRDENPVRDYAYGRRPTACPVPTCGLWNLPPPEGGSKP
jgi:RHS repeat-associated protein